MTKQSKLEQVFESFLWKSRLVVLIAVVFGVIGALSLFITGTYDMIIAVKNNLPTVENAGSTAKIVSGIIGAVDLYLIGIVILLFSFGIYELFISKIDIARKDKELNVLEITSLDDLKNRILKVIIMVLVVSFFKQILEMKFQTAQDMLFFAISIFGLSLTAYFLRKEE